MNYLVLYGVLIDHMINYVGVAIKVNEIYLLSKFG